jgi:hypothetical protein
MYRIPRVRKKKNNYIKGAQERTVNGIKFKSKLELHAYERLKYLEIPFEYQKKIILQPTFKYRNQTIRALSWTMDFYFPELNVVMDTKGFATNVAKIKMKLAKMYFQKNGSEPEFLVPRTKGQVEKELIYLLSLMNKRKKK